MIVNDHTASRNHVDLDGWWLVFLCLHLQEAVLQDYQVVVVLVNLDYPEERRNSRTGNGLVERLSLTSLWLDGWTGAVDVPCMPSRQACTSLAAQVHMWRETAWNRICTGVQRRCPLLLACHLRSTRGVERLKTLTKYIQENINIHFHNKLI